MERIYLDNAATSWPKPESVYCAIDHAQRVIGAPAGRGGYEQVVEALRLVEQTRGALARLINAPNRRNIAFTFNGTDSLSTAIFGLLKPGDHVVTSVVEHNSVLRPLKHLEAEKKIQVTYVGCDANGLFDETEIASAIRPDTRLVCLTHVGNVTGAIQPLENIGSICKANGHDQHDAPNTIFLIDAAQSLGYIPVNVQTLGCDILAAPGHKGLLGPLGTGILFVNDQTAPAIQPLRFGGTGTDGSVETQPTKTPDKFESGNLNVPGIAGINAGLIFLKSAEGIAAHENWETLSGLLLESIVSTEGITLHGPATMENRIGVFSISIDGLDCHEASSILDSNWSVQTRSGLHCAPLVHRAMGTEKDHGSLRLSVGLFNTKLQIEKAASALRELAQHAATVGSD
ncbi:MAG: aminotransferase class V-fold PLP-dependent enzyme [Mariniblastus sp.]